MAEYKDYDYPLQNDYYDVDVTNENFRRTKSNLETHNADSQAHPYDNPAMPEVTTPKEALDSLWANKANKGVASKYPMQYVANLSPYKDSYYCKNEFGEVIVHIAVVTNDNSKLQPAQIIAILPEGFRPMATVEVGAMFAQNSATLQRNSCAITVSSNGSILVHPPDSNSGFCLSSFVLITRS